MKVFLKVVLIVSALFTANLPAFTQNYVQLKGEVIDASTKKPLAYGTVGIHNKHLGTITNEVGYFSLFIPDSLLKDSIQINYLGYEPFIKAIGEFSIKKNKIKLAPVSTAIKAVTVRPLTARQIIDRVLENYDTNYPGEPFISKGFYLHEIIENDIYLDFFEMYTDLYIPSYNDTSKCLARIIQGRTKDDLGEMQFMKRTIEKKAAKQEKKAKRKNDTISIDSIDMNAIQVDFQGPQSIATMDVIRQMKSFDKKYLKKFNYNFEENTFLGGKELYVIRCKSKGTVEHARIDAKLYVDKSSFALVNMKINMDVVVPLLASPIIRLMRIKIEEIHMEQDIEYRQVNNVWFPSKSVTKGKLDVTKKYRGRQRDHSIITIRKAFVTTNIEDRNVNPFPIEEQISDKPLKEQIGEYQPEFWLNKNKIEYEISN